MTGEQIVRRAEASKCCPQTQDTANLCLRYTSREPYSSPDDVVCIVASGDDDDEAIEYLANRKKLSVVSIFFKSEINSNPGQDIGMDVFDQTGIHLFFDWSVSRHSIQAPKKFH